MVLCRSNRNHVEDSAVTGVMIVSGDYLYGVLFSHELHVFLCASAIMKLRKAFLCVVCGQGRKKLCAGGGIRNMCDVIDHYLKIGEEKGVLIGFVMIPAHRRGLSD